MESNLLSPTLEKTDREKRPLKLPDAIKLEAESNMLDPAGEKTDMAEKSPEPSHIIQNEYIPYSPGEMSPILILPDDDDDDDDDNGHPDRGLVFNYNQAIFDSNLDLEDLKYGNFLTVEDNEMLKYHRELRSHSHTIEKKVLSPIAERKVSSPGNLSLHSESGDDKKVETETKKEKRRQFFASFKNLSREKRSSSSDGSASGTNSPNIQKMMRNLLLKDASDDNVFMAIDPVEIERKISKEHSPLLRARSASFKRSSSLKRFFSPIMTRWFSSSSSRVSSRNTSGIFSDSSETDVRVVVQSSESNYSKAYGIEDLVLSPRSKRIQRQKNMAMRRNSSPELLMFSTNRFRKNAVSESISSKNENKSIKLQRKKRSVKSEAKSTKIENRQCTPKLRHKNKNMKKAQSFDSESGSLRKKCLVKSISVSGTEQSPGSSGSRRSMSSPRSIRYTSREGDTRRRYVEHVSRRDAAMSASNVSRWLQSNEASSKKSSFHKKKQNSKEADEEIEQLNSPVDPVYSLLKCAADLPRSGGKSPCMTVHCGGQHPPSYARYPSGGDSSGNTSKTSSPSSSASHSPKTRRKKLNARMKSFSLDTPEPPKQLLGIDETTKKKSSSFTNTCFGGRESPDEKVNTAFSAAALRKKFAFGKASSLEMEDKKQRSYSPSPKQSPRKPRKAPNRLVVPFFKKSQRKERQSVYVALYNFKAKEKDDMDLRAGWRIIVTDSSKKDWWKGKSHGKAGYFPATYVIPIQADQRVFQVSQPLNLSDGNYSVKFHKDQIVFQIGDEADGMILVKAANNKQAMCPTAYLQEL